MSFYSLVFRDLALGSQAHNELIHYLISFCDSSFVYEYDCVNHNKNHVIERNLLVAMRKFAGFLWQMIENKVVNLSKIY